MPSMRTTLTLDPDVAKLLAEEVHRQRKSTKQVVNEALRRGLLGSTPRRAKLRIQPHSTKLRPGIDPGRFNALVDELEDDTTVASFRS